MGPRRPGPRWTEDDRTRLIDERCGEYESEWRGRRAPRREDELGGRGAPPHTARAPRHYFLVRHFEGLNQRHVNQREQVLGPSILG